MTLPDPSSLSPEEQALARRLARLGPHVEPSSALDARVLAAARAAAQAPAVPSMVHRPRWPAVAGLAASLVLVVGLAWRLRLQPEPPPAPRQPVAATPRTARPAPAISGSSGYATTPAGRPEAGREAGIAAQAPASEAKPPATPARAPVTAPPEAQAKVALATPKPMALPPPEPPPPPSPSPEVILDSVQRARAAPPAPPPPATARDPDAGVAANVEADTSEAGQANDSAGLREGDEPTDEVPPATAESPAVRDAWLQRIHGLVDAGDIAGARASLREFVRRYPDYPLPEDLRALAR